MNSNLDNLKCVIMRNNGKYNIIKFMNRDVAKQYYKIVLRQTNFIHSDTLHRCISWCKNKGYEYNIIKRYKYNILDLVEYY